MNSMLQDKELMNEVGLEELETAAGGHPFEESFGDIRLYRAGVSYVNCAIGADEYYVGSQRITKDLARTLRSESTELWRSKYAEKADLVGYLRDWKQTLSSKYSINWNGQMGEYSFHMW